jgi:hypothetical protein
MADLLSKPSGSCQDKIFVSTFLFLSCLSSLSNQIAGQTSGAGKTRQTKSPPGAYLTTAACLMVKVPTPLVMITFPARLKREISW